MERNSITNKLHCQAKMPHNLWMLSTPKFANIEMFAHFKHWASFNFIVRLHILLWMYCFIVGIFAKTHPNLMNLDLTQQVHSQDLCRTNVGTFFSCIFERHPRNRKLGTSDGFGLRPLTSHFNSMYRNSIHNLMNLIKLTKWDVELACFTSFVNFLNWTWSNAQAHFPFVHFKYRLYLVFV